MKQLMERRQSTNNTIPPLPRFHQMSPQAQLFVGGVIALAISRFVLEAFAQLELPLDWAAFVFLSAAAIVVQFLGVSALRYFYYHITPSFVFAAIILLGPAAAGLLVVVSYIVGAWRRRQCWYLAAFNASVHFLSAFLAYRAYTAVGGRIDILTLTEGLGLLAGVATYVIINHALVALGLYFIRGLTPSESRMFSFEGITTDFLLLCMGVSLVALWRVQPALSIFALAPLILVHRVLDIPMLEEEARVDPKTGLYNAKYANTMLELELQRARQLNHPLSVLMADLDGLHRVNNTYGHLAGDEVLKQVAYVIRTTVGARGVAARFGGEEFVVVLPNCDAHEAFALAERIRKGVEDMAFSLPGTEARVHITITVGVTAYPDNADNPVELLQRADAALYHGKDHGRNQVCLASVTNGRFKGESAREPVRTSATEEQRGVTVTGKDQPAPEKLERWLSALVTVVILAGAALYAIYLPRVPSLDLAVLSVLVAIMLINEALALDLYMTSTVSLSVVPLLAAAFLLVPAGVAVVAPVEALIHAYRRQPPWYKVAYNLAGHMLAGTAASFVFHALGIQISAATLPLLILPSALAAAAYYAINVGLTATAVALSERASPIRVWREQFQWLWVHFVALGFIALVLIVAYVGLGLYGAFAFLVPLFIVRYAQKQYIDRTADNIRELKALNQDLLAANAEVRQVNEELLGLLARIIDFRDPYVYNHSERVAFYAVAMAREMGLPTAQMDTLRRAAVCHDLGKIGIPDAILNKPGRLTNEEYQAVKEHVSIGAKLLESSHALHRLIPGVRNHHERWDGSGYPDRLAGESIPLEARILAVADAVETMASDRPYKRGMSMEQILRELRRCAGTHFDPAVVDAFIRVAEREGPGFIINSARRVAPERVQWVPQPSFAPG